MSSRFGLLLPGSQLGPIDPVTFVETSWGSFIKEYGYYTATPLQFFLNILQFTHRLIFLERKIQLSFEQGKMNPDAMPTFIIINSLASVRKF